MSKIVCWRSRPGAAVLAALIALEAAVGCTYSPPGRLPVVTAPKGVAARLADLTLTTGTTCVVTLISGETVQGPLVSLTATELALHSIESTPPTQRVVADADIVRVARVTGLSKPARGAIGAGVGAVLSLPLSISMVGDAMLVGALVGSLLGRRTGDSRLEILLQR